MEEKDNQDREEMARQLAALVQHLVHLRPKLFQQESVAAFRVQLDGFNEGMAASVGDYETLWRILGTISRCESPPTMSELGTELVMPASTATRMVDWLVRGGLLERVDDPEDRRIVRVRLTAAGQSRHVAILTYARARLARLLTVFTAEEQRQLVGLLGRLMAALEREIQ